MALINCSECGKEISNKASSCPGCGNPVNNSTKTVKRAGAKYESFGFILIIVGMFMMFADYGGRLGTALFILGFIIFVVGRMK